MLYINRKKILRGFQKAKFEVSEVKSGKMISFLLFFEGVLTNFLPYAESTVKIKSGIPGGPKIGPVV